MAKKKIKAKPKPAPQKAGYQNVFDKHPVWISAIFIFIVLLIFYHQVMLGGKTFESPDKMNSWAVVHFAEQALQENGAIPLWCPFLFSGMPSYGSMLTVPKVNLIDHVLRSYVLNPKLKLIPEPFTFLFLNYLLFALFMYALMRSQKVSPLVALFAGATIIFMPQFIAFTAYGHNTKFLSACLIPLILLFSHKLLEKRNAFYFSLTALAIGYQMMRAHVQVSYYTFLAIGIYFLFTAIADFKEKKSVKQLLASTVLLAGAVTAGILLSAVIYTSVLDYQKFSIRGGGASGGLDFDYASSWSFHPLEMVTFFIPSFMGFGGQTYWGKMPWTDYPLYFSIIVFFLAGLAFILRRDRRTWFWGVIAGFSLVVSFGNHLPLLYTPMFKFLPFFNKFRIPSMIHILFDIAMVVLAACGLQALLATRPATSDAKKGSDVPPKVKKYAMAFSGLVVVIALFVILGRSFYANLVSESRPGVDAALIDRAYEKALLDSFKAVALLGVAVLLAFQYLKQKVSAQFLTLSLIVLVIVDLWIIDFKVINPQVPADEKYYFAETPAVQYMKNDQELSRFFPVLDDKGGNWYMYHNVQNIRGYHAAKLRIYQEFLEETGYDTQFGPFMTKYWRQTRRDNRSGWSPVPLQEINRDRLNFDYAMLDMLNVKYLLAMGLPLDDPRYRQVVQYPVNMGGQQMNAWLYENTSALPRVFFVDSTQVVMGKDNIFNRMKDGAFDPRKTAILEEPPPLGITPGGMKSAEVVSYDLHRIVVAAEVNSPSCLVLSEIFYPSGWTAFVDGQETKIYKTNYILRSIFLEPGKHQIVFKFSPRSFKTGLWTSLIMLILLLIPLVLKAKSLYNVIGPGLRKIP